MSDFDPFLIVEQPFSEAIAWVAHQISEVGLQVMRTFDLRDVRYNPAVCLCPYHGADLCDCQMVVMLVYGEDYQPVSLVAHSHDNTTWISLVNTPYQRADPRLERAIRSALPTKNIRPKEQVHLSHAN